MPASATASSSPSSSSFPRPPTPPHALSLPTQGGGGRVTRVTRQVNKTQSPCRVAIRARGVAKITKTRMETLLLGPVVDIPVGLDPFVCVRAPKLTETRVRTRPREPYVELPMGHDPCEGCAEFGGGPHANPPTAAVGGAPCGPCGARSFDGCAEIGPGPHANLPTEAVNATPCVRKLMRARMQIRPLGP